MYIVYTENHKGETWYLKYGHHRYNWTMDISKSRKYKYKERAEHTIKRLSIVDNDEYKIKEIVSK